MSTEILKVIIDAVSGGAVKGIGETEAAAAGLGVQSGVAGGALKKLGIQGGLTGTAVKAGFGVAAVGLATFAIKGAEHFAELTANVRALQRITKTTAADASALVFAGQRLGISTDQFSTAMGRLAQNIGSGKVALADYNIAQVNNRDGSINMAATLANVADHFSKIKDSAQQADEGRALFGKGWQTLSPLLSKSKDELKDIFALAEKQGLIFDQGQLDKGREMALSLKDLKTAMQGVQVAVGQALVPALTTGAEALTSVIDVVHGVSGDFGVATLSTIALGAAIGGTFGGPAGAGVGAMAGAVLSLKNGLDEAASGDGLGWLYDTKAFLGELLGGGGDEAAGFADKTKQAQEAIRTMGDLAAQGKTHTKEYADAEREAGQAGKELEAAQLQVQHSLEGANAAKLAAISLDLQLAGGALGLIGAQMGVAIAADNIAQKQAAYNEAVQKTGPFSAEAAAAGQALAAAQLQGAQAAVAADSSAAKFVQTLQAQGKSKRDVIAALDAERAKYAETLPAIAAALQAQIDKLNGVKLTAAGLTGTHTVSVNADTGGFFGSLNWVRSSLQGVGRSSASPGIGGQRGWAATFFAEGGVVTRPTRAVVGEAGPEAIIPLSRPSRAAQIMNEAGLGGRGGGVTLNVSVAPFSDPQAVAGEIAEMLRKLQRQTGSLGLN